MISDEELVGLGIIIKSERAYVSADLLKDMAAELLQLREDERTPCRWEQDMDGNWQTGCDNMFVLNDGTPAENRMKFCTYCGHQIEEMP